jgi:hypothetical protein
MDRAEQARRRCLLSRHHGRRAIADRAARRKPVPCRHQFSADVVEVMKGKTAATRLQLDYGYVRQWPEIALFAPGEDFVFALSSIGAGGDATLVGTTCGRPGLEIKDLDKIKRALRRP